MTWGVHPCLVNSARIRVELSSAVSPSPFFAHTSLFGLVAHADYRCRFGVVLSNHGLSALLPACELGSGDVPIHVLRDRLAHIYPRSRSHPRLKSVDLSSDEAVCGHCEISRHHLAIPVRFDLPLRVRERLHMASMDRAKAAIEDNDCFFTTPLHAQTL